MKNKNLKTINDYLFKTLDRLDNVNVDDDYIANIEIKRSNAITSASKTIIASMKTRLDIAKLQESGNKHIKDYEEELGLVNE